MCDYNRLSQTTVQYLPVPLPKVRGYLGPVAHGALLQVVRSGRARPGHDLHDGKPLPNGSLLSGHYMSDGNFQRALARMNAQPRRCQWCGQSLPTSLVRQHQQPHDHREDIAHHFHDHCWRARLLAVAAIFGHIRSDQLLAHGVRRRSSGVREKVIVTVKRVLTLNRRPRNSKWRKWKS
ncbi:MAG: hypothetical protein IH623_06420 [Verrucomicrobia bacterium]|nr:hypothetical protein [Verrucomicrobiota bacterium]